MAGILSGLGNALFGVPPVSDQASIDAADEAKRRAAEYAAREAGDYGNENRLAQSLWGVVNGTSGPSVAGTQLQSGLDASIAGGNSMASGATGVNAALAHYGAILEAGRQAAATNQAAALLQAKQVADARNQIGGIDENQGERSASLEGSNTKAQTDNIQTAAGIAENNQKASQVGPAMLLSGLAGAGSLLFAPSPVGAAAAAPAAAAGAGYSAAAPGYVASNTNYGAPSASDYGSAYSAAAPGYGASKVASGYEDDPYASAPWNRPSR